MLQAPLVSIICTCYNHEKFIYDALNSVINQEYENIELCIINNGSTDNSLEVIQNWLWLNDHFKKVRTFFYNTPRNYCMVFNKALYSCEGKYIVDLSGDDILYSQHIKTAVHTMEESGAAVYFSDAQLLFEDGKKNNFYPRDHHGALKEKVADGDVYESVIRNYVICSASLVFRAKVLFKEEGYDENLSYEDFDILVRLARKYPFIFNENVGIQKRILKNSFSAQQYKLRNSVMLPSTYRVCRKIQQINQTATENEALKARVMYETKHALASANFVTAKKFLDLARELGVRNLTFFLYNCWQKFKLDLSFLYKIITS